MRLTADLVFNFALISVISLSANAQPMPFAACVPQIKSLCPANGADGKPLSESREIFQCLRKNQAELSADCQGEIERYVQAGRQAAARAGGALGSFGGLTSFTPPIPIVAYEGRFSVRAEQRVDNRISLSSPVYGTEKGIATASLSAGQTHLGDGLKLTSGLALRDLYRAEVGVGYSHRLGAQKTLGLRSSIGSTGDRLFQSSADMSFSLNATYGFPGSGKDYWVILVYLANNSPIGNYIPIPGFLYIHKTDHFTGVFGFPVTSLQWTPTTYWSYSLSAFGPLLTTEVSYGEVTDTQTFLQAAFAQQTFILHERARDRDRLTLEEKKVLLGVRTPLLKSSYGELQLGWAFDRKAYVGNRLFTSDGGLADLDPTTFVNVQIKHVF